MSRHGYPYRRCVNESLIKSTNKMQGSLNDKDLTEKKEEKKQVPGCDRPDVD